MVSDTELAARAKKGDEAAFAALVRTHLPSVFSFLARYLGDEAAAEDAAQETFVKAWRNIGRFDAARAMKPWLMQIARNSANDSLRKKRPLPFSRLISRTGEEDDTAFEDTLADDAPLPSEVFERKELGTALARALAELPERDRALLVLRYEDGLPFEDIASVLKAPPNTVKSWHRRALGRLRSLLARTAPNGDNGA